MYLSPSWSPSTRNCSAAGPSQAVAGSSYLDSSYISSPLPSDTPLLTHDTLARTLLMGGLTEATQRPQTPPPSPKPTSSSLHITFTDKNTYHQLPPAGDCVSPPRPPTHRTSPAPKPILKCHPSPAIVVTTLPLVANDRPTRARGLSPSPCSGASVPRTLPVLLTPPPSQNSSPRSSPNRRAPTKLHHSPTSSPATSEVNAILNAWAQRELEKLSEWFDKQNRERDEKIGSPSPALQGSNTYHATREANIQAARAFVAQRTADIFSVAPGYISNTCTPLQQVASPTPPMAHLPSPKSPSSATSRRLKPQVAPAFTLRASPDCATAHIDQTWYPTELAFDDSLKELLGEDHSKFKQLAQFLPVRLSTEKLSDWITNLHDTHATQLQRQIQHATIEYIREDIELSRAHISSGRQQSASSLKQAMDRRKRYFLQLIRRLRNQVLKTFRDELIFRAPIEAALHHQSAQGVEPLLRQIFEVISSA